METERRECLRVEEGVVEGEGGVSWYLREISLIARSMSSRSEVEGVVGLSEGVVGAGLSSLGFRFFFLFLDFLMEVGCAEATLEGGMDGGCSTDTAVCCSSSGSSISFN